MSQEVFPGPQRGVESLGSNGKKPAGQRAEMKMPGRSGEPSITLDQTTEGAVGPGGGTCENSKYLSQRRYTSCPGSFGLPAEEGSQGQGDYVSHDVGVPEDPSGI